jgi:hypothetical protein
VTDGSGHQDGFGGYAFLLFDSAKEKIKTGMGAMMPSTVETCEFTALLEGLKELHENHYQKTPGLRSRKAVVRWLCDREALILSVLRSPEKDGGSVFKRRSVKDLWRRFEFFEEIFDICPVFMKRDNLVSSHSVVDKVASEMRVVLKEYYETFLADQIENEK